VSLSVFPIKAANTLIMNRNDHIAFDLTGLQDQKSLTLCRRSISQWGRERETRSVANKGSQYPIYEWSQLIAKQITNDARPKIIDAPLTLIFAIGVSTLWYHLFWCNISLMVFWQPLYRLHILSPSSKHCSLRIVINISFKIYFKVSTNCK